jgi:hypothetical protein
MTFYNAIGFYLRDRGEPGVLSGLSGCAKVKTLPRNMASCGVSDTALGPDLGTIALPANAMCKPQAANDSLPLIANRNHSLARRQATNTNRSCDVLYGVVHWLRLL